MKTWNPKNFGKSLKDANEKFSTEEIEAILAYVPPARDEFDINEELYQKVKKYKQLENAHRRRYRISAAKLAKFRASTSQYLGAHNFHNFTLGKDFKEPSAIRFMKDIKYLIHLLLAMPKQNGFPSRFTASLSCYIKFVRWYQWQP